MIAQAYRGAKGNVLPVVSPVACLSTSTSTAARSGSGPSQSHRTSGAWYDAGRWWPHILRKLP
jgi:hypothetical protein